MDEYSISIMEASPPSAGSAPSPLRFAAGPALSASVAASIRAADVSGNLGTIDLSSYTAASRPRRSARSRNVSQSSRLQNDSRSEPTTRPSRKRRSPDQTPATPSPPAPTPKKRARAKASNLKKPPPPQAKVAEGDKKPSAVESCCICMCEVKPDDLAGISGCEHHFCFGCIEKWAERENTCPLCKNRFNKIDRVNKKRKKGQKNTKRVKQRDQRSDLVPGAALEGLLGRLLEESQFRLPRNSNELTEFLSTANFASRNPPSIARLIFSGIGNLDFNSLPGPSARISRARSMARGDDPSSDEEESPLSSFIRAFHGHGVPVMQVVQPVTFSSRSPSRSYASNGNDRTAGNGAENPLHIDDSDSDDDDDVQVWTPRNGSS